MRVVPLYVLLVVIPAFGVGLILLAGTRREARYPLGTEWIVELPQTARCVPPGRSPLLVRQSGERLDLRMGDPPVVLSARLDGDRVQGEGRGWRDDGCPAGSRVALTARLVTGRGGEVVSMVGLLSQPGCDSCAPTPFHAIRQ